MVMVATEPFRFAEGVEVHTTDLVEPCMRKVQLRHEGKIDREYTTALYRGQLAHAALEYVHRNDAWDSIDEAMTYAECEVARQAEEEQRPFSRTVERDHLKISEEVKKNLSHYIERRREWFAKCRLIGVELPIRWDTELPGCGAVSFASHLDLLYRDPTGHLVYEDWKWREQSPSMAYLGRNLQFGLYCLMIAYGSIRFDEHLDLWGNLGEFASFGWVDLANFKPYSRKTTITDENGEEVVFSKGDERPLRNIVKTFTYDPDREDLIKRELAVRVVAMRHGLFPMNPDPLGCALCECRRYCQSFHGAEKGA